MLGFPLYYQARLFDLYAASVYYYCMCGGLVSPGTFGYGFSLKVLCVLKKGWCDCGCTSFELS